MVALNSKTFIVGVLLAKRPVASDKLTSSFSKKFYKPVLKNQQRQGVNRDFVFNSSVVYTYSQLCMGLIFLYAKKNAWPYALIWV